MELTAPLSLYALAEARYKELEVASACSRCKDCPGPERKGSRCYEWAQRGNLALQRSDWPVCPVGLTKVAAWRRIVERFIASKVTPLADFPESYLAVVHDAFVELHVALKAEERRSVDEARSKPRGPAMSTKIGGRK